MENGPVEIVDFPIKNGGSFHRLACLANRFHRQRQTLFFTATWPQSVRRLAAELLGGKEVDLGLSENSVPLNPMVLLIIIPFLNGYFIGNINPTFSDKPMCWAEKKWISPRKDMESIGMVGYDLGFFSGRWWHTVGLNKDFIFGVEDLFLFPWKIHYLGNRLRGFLKRMPARKN